MRLESEQYRSPTIGENATDKTSTTGYQGPGLLDFDGLLASYGLFGFVLFYVPVFHHLWFLCWLVALFAAFASVADKFAWKAPPCWLISGPLRYLWLLPLTMLFQSVMVMRLPWFGPDTSPGLLPAPHVLGYFGVFFGFGALYYGSDDEAGRLGKWWWLHLAIGLLLVFPYGMSRSAAKPEPCSALFARRRRVTSMRPALTFSGSKRTRRIPARKETIPCIS